MLYYRLGLVIQDTFVKQEDLLVLSMQPEVLISLAINCLQFDLLFHIIRF